MKKRKYHTKKKYKKKKYKKHKRKTIHKKRLKYKRITRLGRKWIRQMELFMKSVQV